MLVIGNMEFKSKKQKKFIITLCVNAFLIFASLIISITAFTVSWFANNRNVDANDISLQIDSMASVVISDTVANLKTATSDNTSVSLTRPSSHTGTALQPATHSGNAAMTSASNLIYSSDPTQINETTGLPTVGELATQTVPLNVNSPYYIDYNVYIGSINKSITGSTVYAKFTTALDKSTFKAASSIDFYVDGAYCDTLNLAGYDSSLNDYSTEKIVANLGERNIPLVANDMTALNITMRTYFDGNLLKNSGATFVTSKSINLSSATSLGVSFEISGGTEA